MRNKHPALLAAAGLASAACASPANALSVTAVYEAHLLVKLADVRTDQVIAPDSFRTGARVTTIGALGVFKPIVVLAQSNGRVVGGFPAPAVYAQTVKAKRRVTRYAASTSQRTAADPLTQSLRAALQPAGGSPCLGLAPVFDGRQRYDLNVSPAGTGNLEGQASRMGLAHPVACRLGFHPISGFTGGPPKKNPFIRSGATATFAFEPRAGVWVMTDVAVPTLVGTGHITLTSLNIVGAKPTFTQPPLPPPHKPLQRRSARRG